MPYYKDNKNIHDAVVIRLARQLKRLNPEHKISANPQIKKQKAITLDGKEYYPDIIDDTAGIVYEVHWKGERKEEQFDKLPAGWQGVNVFIEDSSTPHTIVVKVPGYRFAVIVREEFKQIIGS